MCRTSKSRQVHIHLCWIGGCASQSSGEQLATIRNPVMTYSCDTAMYPSEFTTDQLGPAPWLGDFERFTSLISPFFLSLSRWSKCHLLMESSIYRLDHVTLWQFNIMEKQPNSTGISGISSTNGPWLPVRKIHGFHWLILISPLIWSSCDHISNINGVSSPTKTMIPSNGYHPISLEMGLKEMGYLIWPIF